MELSPDAKRDFHVQSYGPAPVIDGVELVELRRFADDGGSMTELARLTDARPAGLGDFSVRQVNYSEVEPGVVKAYHVHTRQTDVWYVPPSDRMLVVLVDVRRGSRTEGTRIRLVLGAGVLVTTVADGIYLFELDSYQPGAPIDVLWPLSALLIASSGWIAARAARGLDVAGRPLLLVPTVCAVVGIGILVVDHYDSFVYNLVQLVESLGRSTEVVRSDLEPAGSLVERGPEAVLLSPGPGRPEDAGCFTELLAISPR